jgi:hypothetical protein
MLRNTGLTLEGLGFKILSSGVYDSGFRVQGSRLRVSGFVLGVKG